MKYTGYLTNYIQKIKFRKELETNGSMNFLDLKISNNHNFIPMKFTKKPTNTDNILNSNSCHPTSQKYAYFHSMINRINNLPLEKESIDKEIQIFKYIAYTNDYNPDIGLKIYEKCKEPKNKISIHTNIKLVKEEPEHKKSNISLQTS